MHESAITRGFELKYCAIGHLRIAYYVYDANQAQRTIVCLHGLTRTHRDFIPLVPLLPIGAKIIVIEQRGRGLSEFDCNPDNYHLLQYISDTWKILDSEKVNDFDLIGTSMGGLMGLVMHAEQPKRINRLILNDIGPEVCTKGFHAIAASIGQNLFFSSFQNALAFQRHASGDCYPNFDGEQWEAFTKMLFKETENGFERDYDPNIAINIKAAIENNVELNLWPQFLLLKEEKTPVLLIHGELSSLLSKEIVDKMKAALDNLSIVTIEQCGHAPLLTEQKAYKAMGRFLND